MRLTSVLIIAVSSAAFVGCESDQAVDDRDYVRGDDSRGYIVGQDEYEHGVPDRMATERGIQAGGVASPNSADQSRGEVSTMDRTFVEEAMLGGLFEVESAQLALEREDDPQIKQIASMILEDHRKANQELQAIAQRKGIEVPRELSSRYQEMMIQLQQSRDADFARTFQELQEKAHEDAIRLFERQASEGQDADLKLFAERTLPVLRKHMDHVQHFDAPSEYNPRAERV